METERTRHLSPTRVIAITGPPMNKHLVLLALQYPAKRGTELVSQPDQVGLLLPRQGLPGLFLQVS